MSHYIEIDAADEFWEVYNEDDTFIFGGLTLVEAARLVNFLNGGLGIIEDEIAMLLAKLSQPK